MMNTNGDNKTAQVIVSLTSFPAAIEFVLPTVRSILAGTVLPDKIVLYLTYSQFEDSGIPQELLDLSRENPIFEIRNYDSEIRSYRKLIPALKDFPEAVIVTIDDDTDYHPDMLASLLRLHRQFPDHVLAHRAKRILPDKPYKKWPKLRWYHFLSGKIKISPAIIQTGVGGVLYPPHSLKEDMLDEKLFREMAPTTDDIWFWAAAVANGRTVIPVPFGPHNKPKGLGKPRELALKTVNFKSGTDRNDLAFKAIIEKYPEVNHQFEK
ncbi:glycosyltransferase [Duncaniella sp.]|uniref:glycosyltransferase n=1 Tax=Duncaniella sp. TaxID=2518496 RepID=UPI002607C5E7|nr:glycosyltransferase [Duncaniella sp.]